MKHTTEAPHTRHYETGGLSLHHLNISRKKNNNNKNYNKKKSIYFLLYPPFGDGFFKNKFITYLLKEQTDRAESVSTPF
jgi:hypothetical protein